jgi:hypothetical protein
MELGQTVETRGRRAQQAGQKWAARIPDADGWTAEAAANTTAHDEDALDRAALRTVAVFRRMGFAPELADPAKGESKNRREKTIRLQACPVRSWPWRIRGRLRSTPRPAAGLARQLGREVMGATRLTPVRLGPPGTLRHARPVSGQAGGRLTVTD